jgi:hypothetical protein
MESQLCHDAEFGPPANALPAKQRREYTNSRDLSLTRVSVGCMILAYSHQVLLDGFDLTMSTNLGIHERVIQAWAAAIMVLDGSGES